MSQTDVDTKGNETVYSFKNLPDVILLKVFSYLNVGDLCRTGRACVRWYQLTRSPVLWKSVDANDMQLSSYQVEKLIPILPPCVLYLRMRSLSIQQRVPFLTPQVAMEIRERCPLLQTLIIESAFVAKYVHFTDITVEDLPQKLAVLSLRKSFFHTDQFFCSVSHPTVPKIKVLDCSSCWCIRDYDIPFFTRLSDLQEVYLSGCPISDFGVSKLLKSADNLKVLDLEATFVEDKTVFMLSERCRFLERLFLGNTRVSDCPLRLLTKASLPRLKSLCLTRTCVSEVGIRSAILNLRSLKHLNVGTCSITSDILELTCLMSVTRNLKLCHADILDGSDYCDHFLDSIRKYKH